MNGIAPLAQQLGFDGVHRVVASDHPAYEEHNRVLDGVRARTLHQELHIGRQEASSSASRE
ncbi:MAG: hypothetical protein ACLQBY_13175 [Solirubrobacteraceae bacterium]